MSNSPNPIMYIINCNCTKQDDVSTAVTIDEKNVGMYDEEN